MHLRKIKKLKNYIVRRRFKSAYNALVDLTWDDPQQGIYEIYFCMYGYPGNAAPEFKIVKKEEMVNRGIGTWEELCIREDEYERIHSKSYGKKKFFAYILHECRHSLESFLSTTWQDNKKSDIVCELDVSSAENAFWDIIMEGK